jgi:hypothetical protein
MKERKGPFGLIAGGIVDSVVQTARRRAQDREPRAVVYAADGRPRILKPDEPGHEELVATATALIDLVGAGRDGVAADAEADDADADPAEAEAETQAEAEAADDEAELHP